MLGISLRAAGQSERKLNLMLPPGITRLRGRQRDENTRLYWNGRDSTCPIKGYNARYLYYPTKQRARLSVIQLSSSVIGTPMNILGPVLPFLPRRPLETRVPAISLPSRLGFSSSRSVSDRLLPGAFVIAALLVRPGVGQPFEVGEMVTGFGQLESALDSIACSSMHGGEGGEGVDLLVGVHHLIVGGPESIEVGCDPPVFQVSGLVLDDGESGGWASDDLEQPIREWNDGLLRVVDPGVHVNDGRGSGSDVGVGKASDSEVVHLFDPFGRSIDAFCGEDLEVRVVAIVLNIAGRGNGEGLLVVQDLFLQAGKGVVEGVDCLLVVLFSLLNGLGEALDDVGEEGDREFSRVALEEVEGGPRGEWRTLVARVVEHADRVKEWRIQCGTVGGVNGLERREDCSSSVTGGGLWRGVRGSDLKLNGERRNVAGGNERGDGTPCPRRQGGLDGGVDGVVRHCAMMEGLDDDREETAIVFILSRGCFR